MKNDKFVKIFVIIINCMFLIESNDLFELGCINVTQCQQFQNPNIKAWCVEEYCQCETLNGEIINCKPQNHYVNNIIGGYCPCKQLNAICDSRQHICYCANDYMPSKDKRRCIKKMVALNENCELDSQCQLVDFNAICYAGSKQCSCMEQFVIDEGKCVSIVGINFNCTTDAECIEKYGANTKCSNSTQHCVCIADHFSSLDNTKCLKTSKYLEYCNENIQCIGTMGLGGICSENICQCSEKYFVEEKKIDGGLTKTVCSPIIERGLYCRYDKDCYQRQLNESDQSMSCIYGECSCKMDYFSYNNGDCVKGSAAGIKSIIEFNVMLGFILFVNK